ncbi:MAG: hypothetical protein OEV23_00650, partial [Gallionella sp.]|nr:hypothetical protein [Gallionella sp.]
NRYFSNANVLNAIPSVRVGGVPRSKEIAKELKLANENPARQLNVVLKAGEKEEDVDASVMVTDSAPSAWGASFDNSGSPETGGTRLGLSYRHANVFDADHVASIQYLMSPQHPNSTRVLGGSYKIPLYEDNSSLEFFGGYSNVNALVGGINNFQGGGLLTSVRYNLALERVGIFDPRLSFGFDWRKFRRLEMTSGASTTVIYNDIVVTPLSLTYAAQGKFDKSDLSFNVSCAANLPKAGGGKADDFAKYDTSHATHPESAYKVLRYGLNYSQAIEDDWQFRAALNGQWSKDELIQGEQMRLGGADAVRGFSEGSEGGEVGTRLNLEVYSPDFGKNEIKVRALVFYDAGQSRPVNETAGNIKATIAGTGAGLRINYTEHLSMRMDRARIVNAGSDTTQNTGDWRWHASLNATF